MEEVRLRNHIKNHYILYLMALPGVIYLIMIFFIPIIGNFIAFTDYNTYRGIFASKWAGIKHFKKMFTYTEFLRILRNTMVIGFYNIIFGFPAPIFLALLLNEIRKAWFRRVAQTIIFVPFFLSWVVVARIVYSILDFRTGAVNYIIKALGGEPFYFMIKSSIFPIIVALSGIWRNSGFSCIIYLAALTSIDPQLYEAARIDGAGRFKQILNITLPLLVPTMLVVLLLNIGRFLNTGFNQIDTLYNNLVRDTGEILINYIYNVGIKLGNFDFATAAGVFQAVIGFILVVGGNKLALKFAGRGLFYVPRKEKIYISKKNK